jgi:triosephosphate isomerase (TIM)
LVKGTNIKLGAQNCSYAESGAYTGEVSVDMLKDAGCDYVILGHSERRVLFGETDEVINKKAKLAISKGLKVVFCVGEVLEERENEKTFEVIKKQIINGLQDLDLNNIIIAYEPVWAIGTGKTASPEQAEEVHSFIRNLIATEFSSNCCSCCCSSKNFADDMIILYGGSVNPSTIQGLMDCKNVDGGLVGGASLKVKDFSEIVKLAK